MGRSRRFRAWALKTQKKLEIDTKIAASEERRSLNDLFREWIARYVGVEKGAEQYRRLMKHLSHARPGRTFSRDEMNER